MRNLARVQWVDCLKGIAIIFVLVDHASYLTGNVLQLNGAIHIFQLTSVSISWFLLLFGYISVISFETNEPWITQTKLFWIKRYKYLWYYIIASIVGYVWLSWATVDFFDFVRRLFYFTVVPPYYYFFILFQSIFLVPFFMLVFKRMTSPYMWIGFVTLVYVGLLPISQLQQQSSWIMPWNLLFGGLPLIFVLIGMGVRMFERFMTGKRIFICAFLWGMLYISLLRRNGTLFGEQMTPFFVLFSTLLFIIVAAFVKHIIPVCSMRVVSFIGRRSLGIFLVHWMVMQSIVTLFHTTDFWLQYTIVFLGSFFCTLGIVEGIERIYRWLQSLFLLHRA
ncbi:MAG: acyltransferase [Microgenomates group bacterium]